MQTFYGKGANAGVRKGTVFVYENRNRHVEREVVLDTEGELSRFRMACVLAKETLENLHLKTKDSIGLEAAAIFEAQKVFLEDELFVGEIEHIICSEQVTAEYATYAITEQTKSNLLMIDDEMTQAKADDLSEVSEHILHILQNEKMQNGFNEDARIVVAKSLMASELLNMDKEKIAGLVLTEGSLYSHVVILAKGMHLPTLIQTKMESNESYNGKIAVIDGTNEMLIVDPTEEYLLCAKEQIKEEENKEKELRKLTNTELITADGRKINICANISYAQEAKDALLNGADGIGLFRSEMLCFDKKEYLNEEEQFLLYKKVAEEMQGKEVVIRTFDFGADKQPAYMPSEKEENPALGMRGIRFCLDNKELLEAQLRAIYRASVFGNLSVMYPMIISMEEIHQIKELTEIVKSDLRECEIPFKEVPQGIMIETPAAVMISDLLAKEVDFFSIGTNDLTQYTLALDRQNPKCEQYYEGVHPAIWRMVEMVSKNAQDAGIKVCVCGELASEETCMEQLLALGIDELSVSPDRLLTVRKKISDICKGE